MFSPPILTANDLPTLKQELQTVFATIAREQAQQSEYIALKPLYAEPGRSFDGMIVVADGTTWDPGGGYGPYIRSNGSWLKLWVDL